MDDLIAWLCAQLDEDERRYESAGRLGYLAQRYPGDRLLLVRPVAATLAHPDDWSSDGVNVAKAEELEVVVIFDERHALADIEAKRAIIEETIRLDTTMARVAAQSLRLHAWAYRYRAGYQQKWAPDRRD